MCHVLIIEDDAIAAYDIRDTLKAEGATSFSFAATEREAIACARDEHPAFITSDVMLGSGSGPGAVRVILAEHGPVRVFFMTVTPQEFSDWNGDLVLEKPFDTVRLAAMFRSLAPMSARDEGRAAP